MATEWTEEQLNKLDQATLVQLFLNQQTQLNELDRKMQLMLEQLATMNRRMFGKSSEKLDDCEQLYIDENGDLAYFNEAEAVFAMTVEENQEKKQHHMKPKGKREADISGLPVIPVSHMMTEEQLIKEFGENGWSQLEDDIYRRYRFTPMKIEIEEHHVGVYKSRKDKHFKRADHPAYLLRNSLVSPTLIAGIWNAKYVNAMPLYRQEKDFQRMGVAIDRTDMANWTITIAERYLSIFYNYLKKQIVTYHVIQADETPVRVTKENRSEGSKHYMWVYRTGKLRSDRQIVLYEYQPTRKTDHPEKFLENFEGICVTDGYQVYHTLEKKDTEHRLRIAGCWAHVRRRFDEAVAASPEKDRKKTLAFLALKQIQAIYNEDKKLRDMTPEERLEHRQLTVKPLVDAYFAWVQKNCSRVDGKSKTGKGFTYSLNQEKYLRTFLEDGEVPLDNNSAEQAIRGFCIGKKNWVMIDTINGADASAMIYSIVETAKANNLKPYNYLEYLLTVIPEHLDDHGTDFCEDLLPWSSKLPESCRKTV